MQSKGGKPLNIPPPGRQPILVLQRIRRVFGKIAIESGLYRFLTNRKNVCRIYLIELTTSLGVGSTVRLITI